MNEEKPGGQPWLVVAFGLSLAVSVLAVSVGWGHSISDQHGFRQAQTAISVDYLLRGSSWVRYETPVLGPPWSIPLEFPLYQWLVTIVVGCTGLPIDQAGRVVSVVFFYLCLAPIWSVTRRLGVERSTSLVMLSLFLVSPLYLFWSRTVMIESLGLFLSLTYLAMAFRSLTTMRSIEWGMAVMVGALAGMVKPTTWLGGVAAWGVMGGAHILRYRRVTGLGQHQPRMLRSALVVVMLVAAPLLATVIWGRFADVQRSRNPLAAGLLTVDALDAWTFGTIGQKLDARVWRIIVWDRGAREILGHQLMLPLTALGVVLAQRRRRECLVSLLLFAFLPATFTNLHVVHNYYAYANGVFLIAAAGWAIVALVEEGGWRRRVGVVYLMTAMVTSVAGYDRTYLPVQAVDRRPLDDLAAAVQETVPTDDVLLIYGWDWSPEIPYHARRRAIMDREDRSLDHPPMSESIGALVRDGRRIGGLVICFRSRGKQDLVEGAAVRFGLSRRPVHSDRWCDLYGPASRDARVTGRPGPGPAGPGPPRASRSRGSKRSTRRESWR